VGYLLQGRQEVEEDLECASVTEEEVAKIIKAAGFEWNRTRGDMASYLRIVIRLTEEKVRANYIKETNNAKVSQSALRNL
jgi:hypothetical protein